MISTPVSRTEVNFGRLLAKCESMASENQLGQWRFEKYVAALEEKLGLLKKLNVCQPSKETLGDYTKKVEFLKGLVVTEKMETIAEKAVASQLLCLGSNTSPSQQKIKEIQLQTQNRYTNEMREELLGRNSTPSGDGLKQRLLTSESSSEELDTILQYHNIKQEKVANEMVALVQNMKQNSLLAGKIIKKDVTSLEKTVQLAEKNYGTLKVESERLETHVKNACKWWIWILLGVVCITFLWMILFIKLFPKKKL